MNKFKSLLKKISGLILFLLIGCLIGVSLILFSIKMKVSPDFLGMNEILFFVLVYIFFILAFYLQIIIHEGGHLIFGLLSGYKFVSFRVGSDVLVKYEDEGYKFKKMSLVGTGGQCLLDPPEKLGEPYPYNLYNYGGVILNLLTSILAIGLIFLLDGLVLIFLFLFAFVGIFFAILNGVPFKGKIISNDARNAQILNKDENARKYLWLQLKIYYLAINGTRLKDMPDNYFEAEGDNSLAEAIKVSNISRLMDKHEFSEAKIAIDEFFAKHDDLSGYYKVSLELERLFINLLHEKENADLKILEDDMVKAVKSSMKNFITNLRIDYAVAKLYEKDEEKAAKIKEKFDKVCQSHPIKADVELEKELVEIVDKAVDQINRPIVEKWIKVDEIGRPIDEKWIKVDEIDRLIVENSKKSTHKLSFSTPATEK